MTFVTVYHKDVTSSAHCTGPACICIPYLCKFSTFHIQNKATELNRFCSIDRKLSCKLHFGSYGLNITNDVQEDKTLIYIKAYKVALRKQTQ